MIEQTLTNQTTTATTSGAGQLEFNDIQGILLSAYAHLNEATYLFLGIEDGTKARQWLQQIKGDISSAAAWPKGSDGKVLKPETQVNIAFTYAGLELLGLSQESLQSFAAELREGPIGEERSKMMGDIGDSAPVNWEIGGPNNPTVHILLMLFAGTSEKLQALQQQYLDSMAKVGGVKLVYDQDCSRLPDFKEHFGYRDGVSQPAIKGAMNATVPGQGSVAAGEFILGYRNEYDLIPPMPQPDILGKNGTYLVFRKLAQNVGAFNDFLKEKAGGDQRLADYFGAKVVGRWKSGAPLALTPDKDAADMGADPKVSNNFQFADDPHGYHTPLGSHIRRSNPRDGLEHDPAASAITTRRHRIMRRGRPYGSPYSEAASNEPRGTLFIALNTDIKRQFEFIQETWINNPKFAGLYNDSDPIAGDHCDGSNAMTIQRWPARRELQGMPRFVTVKGAGYFFVPGLRALAYIAEGSH